MAITLNDFRAIANGDYNAGQIDFKTNSTGEVTGLKKVNHHVTLRGLNKVEISTARAVEVKEAFVKALSEGGGVSAEKIKQIREQLTANASKTIQGPQRGRIGF